MSVQLIFGSITRQEAERLFNVNPCVSAFGLDPFGRSCRTCKHLVVKQFSRRYHKCAFRKNTNGPGTDHRVNWPACAKYEKAV